MREKRLKMEKFLLLSIKISIGSSLAIYFAEFLGLQYAASAGIVTLLSVLTTKWGTLKLSLLRIATFLVTAAGCWLIFRYVNGDWIGFGIFLFFMVIICELTGLRNTLSVNAVIATHLLTSQDFSVAFFMNEFLLVAIGVGLAFVLNLFHGNKSHKKIIIENMRYTEQQLQEILERIADYLGGKEPRGSIWTDIIRLEDKLKIFIEQAYEYQNNTWQFHPAYYIDYFEMREKQYTVLHNLHYEIKKIRTMPTQAAVIAGYIRYLKKYVVEMNNPEEQIKRLHKILEEMEKAPLPASWEEFEGKAKVYHIMMDLEEFLIYKKRFVESLDEKKLRIYWNKEKAGE